MTVVLFIIKLMYSDTRISQCTVCQLIDQILPIEMKQFIIP